MARGVAMMQPRPSRAVAWTLLGQGGARVLGLLLTLLLARGLAARAEYGAYVWAVAVASACALVCSLAGEPVLRRVLPDLWREGRTGEVRALARRHLCLRIGMIAAAAASFAAFPGAFGGPAAAEGVSRSHLLALVWGLGAALALRGLVREGILESRLDHAATERWGLGAGAARLALTLVILLHGGGVLWVLAAWLAVEGAQLAVLAVRALRLLRGGPGAAPGGLPPGFVRGTWVYSALITAAFALEDNLLDPLMLGALRGADDLGLWGIAAAFGAIPGALAAGQLLRPVLLPLLSQGGADASARRAEWVRRFSLWSLASALPVAAWICVFAEPLLRHAAGPGFVAGAPTLRLLACSGVASVLYLPLGMAVRATDRLGVTLVAALLPLLHAAANVWLVPAWGVAGAALGAAAVQFGTLGYYLIVARRIDPAWVRVDISSAGKIAALAGALCVSGILAAPRIGGPGALVSCALVFAAMYGLGLFALRVRLLDPLPPS
ncbi:MAG: polysaccharide biosynthesis C-terminal domain-containing protein [Planctomycetes bacterium]|nr:polysaccharide biosynthesis C-terminal domain-containing protein [Planctomycetota bacterium]